MTTVSNKLKVIMLNITSVNQTTLFITSRQILDGFVMAIKSVQIIKKSGKHSFVMKVDFHKTFNSVV